MKVISKKIPDIKVITPDIHEDDRGYFFESFNQRKFSEAIGSRITFVQDNESSSKKGVLRGMHYQKQPFAQGKLIHVNLGEIFDVALDIRKDSPTYGKWVSEILSADNKKQLWIPEGFAHGFLTLSEEVKVLYKTTNFYSKAHEKTIKYNSKKFNIKWPEMAQYILSDNDKNEEASDND
jgi:dTDP-4-dehydrorhamnose 3,5-epimerase